MSSSLKWRPAMSQSRTLPRPLKYPLSRRLWDTDGSTGHGDAVVTVEEHLPYLEGLRDAGVEGAQELIDILNKHVAVIVWHEH